MPDLRTKKTIRKIIRSVLAIVSFTLLFCGCNKENNDIMWQQENISDSEGFMTLTEYYPNIFSKINEGHHWNNGIAANSEGIYSYDVYKLKNQDTGVYDSYDYISFIDGDTKQIHTTEYQMDGLFITSFIVINNRKFGIYQNYDETVKHSVFGLVEFMENGKYIVMPDLYGILEAENLILENNYISEIQLFYESDSDCYYIISEDGKKLIKADSGGNELFCVEGLSELGYGDEGQDKGRFLFFSSLNDGRLAFIYLMGENEIIFTVKGAKAILLAEKECGPEAYGEYITRDYSGQFLFLSNQMTVVSWDISTGKMEHLFEDIIDDYYSPITCMMRNKNGELLIVKGGNLMVFTQSGPLEIVEITVKPLGYLVPGMKSLMQKYTQTHPGVKFKILEETEFIDRGNTMAKLVVDVAGGGGPDMVIIDQSELYDLADKEILADLSKLLSDSTREKLFDAVVDYGTIGDRILMLPTSGAVKTLIVQNKYCLGDSWTLEDLLDVLEQGNENGEAFEYIVVKAYTDDPFYILALASSILEKELVDCEKGISYFNSDAFVRFLKVCKEYTDRHTGSNYERNLTEEECRKLFLRGDSLLYTNDLMSVMTFSELKKMLGDDFNCIGYPMAGESGNFISFGYGFAMVKNCKKVDIIVDFLNWIYYCESPEAYRVPLRKDIYDGKIELPDEWNQLKEPAIRTSEKSIITLAGKEDGSTFIDEYFELLESCKPATDHRSIITEIICEETAPFFAGAKTAEETAEIIHKRVSLYLLEMR